ncbi:MAG: prepilin-type N-terminal cleavage/methylation domain-containing protein [Deltaproteobacteria bacterium]|nr:prepilin-type N-terminal cleavage/methylation domain-containing protein [Deltaproteobacteria bacterium]
MTIRGRQSGFTLLELVLALVIFGMISAIVYSAFYFGHRAVTSGERSADENQRMRLAEEMLGRQVRSAVYYFAHYDDEENVPFFLGAADGLMFVTSAPQSRGGTGLAAVTYRLVEGKLVVEERVNFTPKDLYDAPSDGSVQRAVLLEGFTSFRFEYMAAEERDLGWVDKWDARDEDDLPGLVRVTVDGLPYFGGAPWIREIPLFTRAAGWGTNDFQEPPEDETEDDEQGMTTTTGGSGGDDEVDEDEELDQ